MDPGVQGCESLLAHRFCYLLMQPPTPTFGHPAWWILEMVAREEGENQLHIPCCQGKTALVTPGEAEIWAWVALSRTCRLLGQRWFRLSCPLAGASWSHKFQKLWRRWELAGVLREGGRGRKQPHCHP